MNEITKEASKQSEKQSSQEGPKQGNLKLGLDVHYRQVTVAMQEQNGPIKVVGKMSHQAFSNWITKKQRERWQVSSCYEAGASGYWLDRALEQQGVNNLVVVPKAMGQGGQKQKTDRRDSVQLCDNLDRYLGGNTKALSVVAVPSAQEEQRRGLIRFHRQLMKDKARYEARGKGLLCAQGIEVKGPWWKAKGWQELLQHAAALQEWLKEQLGVWRNKILSTQKEEKLLRKRIEAMAPQPLPKGVGAYSAAVLQYELRGFERFKNRRQVASYTGLCPGIHLSDGRGKEGSINRCGNPTVRWTLVETVWRMLRWQPHYEPIKELVAAIMKSRRLKRRLVVKAARRLAVDLWRLATGRTTAQKLGLIMQSDC